MTDLLHQRCRRHAHREAVARCPGCGHTFCRECITEHGDQVRCIDCLAVPSKDAGGPGWRGRLVHLFLQLLGFVVLWGAFYLLAQFVVHLPDFESWSRPGIGMME
jgi:hypothetical protein